jgi:hypothetical protein
MSPNFAWCYFMINALHLASRAPGDTNILAQFLSHITGQNFVRVNITDDNVQTNAGSADSPEHQSNQSTSRNAHPIPSVGISSPPKIDLPSSVDEMKSDDDEDQHSYQTCSIGHNVVHSALFDSADSARFPQGDISPVNKVPPQTRSPSKRKRTPKNKFSPSDQNNQAQSSKRRKYPIGISIASGSSLGVVVNCKWCRGCIMRTQWGAIKKVKREVGVGFDILQYHFFCCKNALSSDELQQLPDVIGASD